MQKLQRFVAVIGTVSLLGAGCGGAAPAPGSSGTGSTPAMPGTAGARSACGSDYYPLKEGSSITYISHVGGKDIPFKISVPQHDGTNIKLEYEITVNGKVSHINQELVCENGTIKGKGYFDFAQAFSGLNISYDVQEMSGDIFPANPAVGTTWNTHTKVKIVSTDTGAMGRMMNGMIVDTNSVSKVLSEESVTVPAGTYKALKIDQTITINQTVGGRPVNTTTHNTAWYVKGVGLVKTQNGTGTSSYTMEAQTITQ